MNRFLVAIALLLVLAADSFAVGYLSSPVVRFWNSTGTALLTNGYVVTCQDGTACTCVTSTTPPTYGFTTYTDSTGLTPNTNPVRLDSSGSASIWYDGTAKITVCSGANVQQWSKDSVSTTAFSTVTVSEWTALSATPTYISTTSFSVSGDYTGTFTAGRRLKISQASTGTSYYTVASSSVSSGVTTVVVVPDSTNLNSTIATLYASLLDPAYPSSPIISVTTKTSGYTFTAADCGKTFISNISSAGTFTFPSASIVPSGCSIVTQNTGSTLTIGATINGTVNPTMARYDSAIVISNGSSWYGLSTKSESCFYAYLSSNQTVTAGSNTKVNINAVKFDKDSIVDITTNRRITPIIAGKYEIVSSVTGSYSGSPAGGPYAQQAIYKNGSNYVTGRIDPSCQLLPASLGSLTTNVCTDEQMTTIIDMNGTSDYIELWGLVVGTPTPVGFYGDANGIATYVRGCRIGY